MSGYSRTSEVSERGPMAGVVTLLRWIPALLVGAGVALLAQDQGVRITVFGWYAAVFGWSVVLPGMLVFRALRGRPTTLPADVALGAATGLCLQLLAWALFTAAGLQGWLLAWPLLAVAPCVAIPRLRRRVWSLAPYERRLAPGTSAVLAAASLWVTRGSMSVAAASPVPPASARWYQDLYWHLSLVGEMKRSVLPSDPQVAGEPFSYHWFANAHIATMSWSTGLDAALVFSRLWLPPVLVLTVLAVAAVGQHLTGRAWPGALAAVMAVVGVRIQAGWFGFFGTTPFIALSPSQEFASPLLLLALVPLVDLCRGRRLPWGSWVVLSLALVGVAGAKGSVLPVVLCGMLLAAFIALVANRVLLRGTLAGLAVVAVVFGVTWPLVAEGGGGSGVQFFSTIRALEPWRVFAGSPLSLGPLPPGIELPGAWTLIAVIVLGWLLFHGWVLLGLPALSRTDLSGWMLIGIGIGGFAAMLLINQDGLSQVYFFASALLGWYLAAAWGFSLLVRRAAGRQAWTAVSFAVAGMAAGVLAGIWARELVPQVTEVADLSDGIARALLPWGVGLAVWAVSLTVLRRTAARTMVALVGCAVLLGAGLGGGLVAEWGGGAPEPWVAVAAGAIGVGAIALGIVMRDRSSSPRRLFTVLLVAFSLTAGVAGLVKPVAPAARPPAPEQQVTEPEAEAALWIRDHSDADDVVATNVHCQEFVTEDGCDARAFWVGALSERSVHIGGWAYTGAARQMHGQNGLPYTRQPFHDEERFAVNEAVFAAPTDHDVAQLRAAGVRYLYANSRAGEVSPELERFARLVQRMGPVSIYEL